MVVTNMDQPSISSNIFSPMKANLDVGTIYNDQSKEINPKSGVTVRLFGSVSPKTGKSKNKVGIERRGPEETNLTRMTRNEYKTYVTKRMKTYKDYVAT